MDQGERDQWIQEYYAKHFSEADRLVSRSANGRVEFLRVQQLVSTRLEPNSRVLDIGGGTGIHAQWLADAGYVVTLIDPVVEQVEAARKRPSRVRALVGDARDLQFEDNSFDAVLLFGPLYHLQERGDRILAWREAWRVLVPGGIAFGAGASRAAAALKMVFARSFQDLPADALIETTDVRDLWRRGHSARSLASYLASENIGEGNHGT